VEWFKNIYPALKAEGVLIGADPGGSAANMIAALRRMGFRTGFYGAAGREDAALLRLDELGEREDLRILETPLPSGRCLALIDRGDDSRDRSLVITPNANDLAGTDKPDADWFAQADWIHLTSFVSNGPLEAQIKVVEKLPNRTRVGFDPGALYCARGIGNLAPILRRTDILFVTEEELESLTADSTAETAVEALFEVGVRTVVVKIGARGIKGFRPDGCFHQPAVAPAQVVDRTGAGDVAAAGFLAGSMLALGLEGSLELAAMAASRSIEGYGRTSYPPRDLVTAAAGKWKRHS
jgi:ribokinase